MATLYGKSPAELGRDDATHYLQVYGTPGTLDPSSVCAMWRLLPQTDHAEWLRGFQSVLYPVQQVKAAALASGAILLHEHGVRNALRQPEYVMHFRERGDAGRKVGISVNLETGQIRRWAE